MGNVQFYAQDAQRSFLWPCLPSAAGVAHIAVPQIPSWI